MKRQMILGILGALGMTVAVTSTAFADHRETRREHREHRENRWERDRGERIRDRREAILARRAQIERARRYEELLMQRRIEARRDALAWERLRAARAAEHRREIARTWGIVYRSPAGRAELAYHAERMAHLHRIRDIARARRDNAFVVRVDRLLALEIGRSGNVLLKIRSTL